MRPWTYYCTTLVDCQQENLQLSFGYTSNKNASMHLSTASQRTPKVFVALQYIVKNIFRIPSVIAVRIGRSIHHTSAFANATGSILIYYEDDNDPTFYN